MEPGTDGVCTPTPEVPLRHTAEGLPVYADWSDTDTPPPAHPGVDEATRVDMEARVAQERKRLEDDAVARLGATQDQMAELPSMGDVIAFIADADAKANGTAKATARRKGPRVTNPGPRKAVPVSPPVKDRRTRQIEDISDEQLLADAGVTPFYSTTEAAEFFDRTNQWLYWGLGRDADKGTGPIFIYPDGRPIEPDRIGDNPGRRRFTLPVIKEILLSSYRRGNIEPEELKKILRRIRINELGGEWREREGWHKIRGKWVHPTKCELVEGKWVKKAGDDELEES
jgi:hypothetical protein